MKKFCVLFVIVFLFVAPVWCQVTGSVESESNSHNREFSTQFQFWLQGQFNKQFSWFGWALGSKDWSEIYPGFSWMPASWIQLGIGAGIEQGRSDVRIGEFLWMGKGQFYFLGFTEHEGSGFWYRAMAMYKINETLEFGLMSQHKLGIGPKVEKVIHKPFSLWVATLFWKNSTTIFGGLKLCF